jgi:uroporphyrinogen decarboxylase
VLLDKTLTAYEKGHRLVAPLMGFPGIRLTGCSIKLAQQNVGEHFGVLRALHETFSPDMLFPLMDLSVEANALGRYTLFPSDDSASG